jgi:hypothetical protein
VPAVPDQPSGRQNSIVNNGDSRIAPSSLSKRFLFVKLLFLLKKGVIYLFLLRFRQRDNLSAFGNPCKYKGSQDLENIVFSTASTDLGIIARLKKLLYADDSPGRQGQISVNVGGARSARRRKGKES